MNQGWIYTDRITSNHAGWTVLDYYSDRYRHSSRTDWADRLALGQIYTNNRPATPNHILAIGDHLAYHRPPWQEPDVPLTFTVCYEDPDLLIIDKPAGLPVMPGGGFLEHTLLTQLQRRYTQTAPVPIHRLGRGTSGLVLLARSPLAKAELTRQMRDRQIHKLYQAIVGPDIPDQLTLTTPIGRIPHPHLGYLYGAVTPQSPPSAQASAKEAWSQSTVLERRADRTLIQVLIQTGRPHQIRIHLATAGFPLLGDPLYDIGGTVRLDGWDEESVGWAPPTTSAIATHPTRGATPSDCGYWLRAQELGFLHPRSQEPLHITAPPTEQ